MKTTITLIGISTILACLTLSAQEASQPATDITADPLLKKFDQNGDGKIDDAERQAIREFMRRRGQQKASMIPSGKTEMVGNREVTELEYASSDGRKIPCLLSMPTGGGPFPCVVTIHGGSGNRDLAYIRTLAAPNPVSPTVTTLNEQPWAVLAISYRAGDGAMFGKEQDDVVAGIRFAKTLPGIDPARVGVMGGSHGGHLALIAAEKMGKEFLCVVAGSPWLPDPETLIFPQPEKPPLSLLTPAVREEQLKHGARFVNGLTRGRGLLEAEARKFLRAQSIEANAEKIVVPSLFLTSLGDEAVPHVLVEPTIKRLQAAGRDVTVFTVEKSPHGFYWSHSVGGARIGKGEKSETELAEEKAAREQIIAFFTKQFARTDVAAVAATPSAQKVPGDAPSPEAKVAKPAVTSPAASSSSGDAPMTREQFKQRLPSQLTSRPEVADRLFDRLDENKDGRLSAEEFAKLKTLRGNRGGDASTKPAETTPAPRPDAPTPAKPSAETKPAAAPDSGDGRKKPTPEQAAAVKRLRDRMANIPVPENLTRRTLTIGGKEREFFINIPESCAGKASPVVFALHGGASSSGLAQHLKVDYTKLGASEGFVTVYPSGVNGWNIGSHDAYSVKRRTSDADDVGFFRAMFDALIKEGIADPQRIYVTGGSNGGVMTQFLICNLADRIAGAGVVVATLPRAAEKNWPRPSHPVPILVMLGTVDPMKPWAGNKDQMSADETLAFWRKQNTCAAEAKKWDLPDRDPNDGCRVHAQRWEGRAPVVFYTMEGHGHGWPMQKGRYATGTGPKTRDISAPEEFWTFLKQQTLTTP